MSLRCPTCGSTDLWQPRRRKSAFDLVLERCGYQRYDCRGCWRRPILRLGGRQDDQEVPPAISAEIAPVICSEEASGMNAVAAPAQPTVIGPTMLIRGEVFSSESICVRGRLEGTLHMNGSLLVIEQGASVTATLASDSLTVCRDGSFIGEVRTGSLMVEDGAYLKCKIETVPASELRSLSGPGGEG